MAAGFWKLFSLLRHFQFVIHGAEQIFQILFILHIVLKESCPTIYSRYSLLDVI